jgi:hypothetical protein
VTELRKEGKIINNTQELKSEPVDFLILPSCVNQTCEATGDYYNDNDTTTDTNGEMNKYVLHYFHDIQNTPDTFSVSIEMKE